MKTFSKTIAAALFMSLMGAAGASAQTTVEKVTVNDEETAQKIKLAEVRLNRVDAKLKQQKNNLNKTYNNVTPDVQEDLNNREDSIYLELLSQKRTVELEIAELKKSQQHYVISKKTPTAETQTNTLIKSGMTSSKAVENKKKTTTVKKKK